MANSVIKVESLAHDENKRVYGTNNEAVDTYIYGRWVTVYFSIYESFVADTWKSISLQTYLRKPLMNVTPLNACTTTNGELSGLATVAEVSGNYTLRFLFHESFTGYARGSITYPI